MIINSALHHFSSDKYKRGSNRLYQGFSYSRLKEVYQHRDGEGKSLILKNLQEAETAHDRGRIARKNFKRFGKNKFGKLTPKERVHLTVALMDYRPEGILEHMYHSAVLDGVLARNKLNDAFLANQTAIMQKFASKLAKDPSYQKAQKNWLKYSAIQKDRFLTSLGNAQCKYLQIEAPNFHFFNQLSTLAGYFNGGSNLIAINTHPIVGGISAHSLMSTVIHEVTHAWQRDFAAKFEAGKIPKTHPYHDDAATLWLGFQHNGYANGNGDPLAYLKQPLEVHANHNAREVIRNISNFHQKLAAIFSKPKNKTKPTPTRKP